MRPLGAKRCVRKRDARVTKDFHEFKIKGDCPAQPPNPNPNPEPPKPEEPPKLEIGPDLN